MGHADCRQLTARRGQAERAGKPRLTHRSGTRERGAITGVKRNVPESDCYHGRLVDTDVGRLGPNQSAQRRPTETKVKPLSPYHATASTIDMSGGEASDLPEMPNVVVPRMPVGRTMSMQPAPATPPVTPTAPPAAGQGPAGATMAPSIPGMGGACGQSCGQQSCNPCGQTCCEPCGPNGPCGPQGACGSAANTSFGLPAV